MLHDQMPTSKQQHALASPMDLAAAVSASIVLVDAVRERGG
jgi:hypothetical protein